MIATGRPPAVGRGELIELLECGRVLELGRMAVQALAWDTVGFAEDEAVGRVLAGRREIPASPRLLHLAPGDGQGSEVLAELRRTYPGVPVHSPWSMGDQADSLSLASGPVEQDWQAPAPASRPVVASFMYSPTSQADRLVERLWRLREVARLAAVVCLPAAPGDLVLVPGASTNGNLDVAVLAAVRLALPGVHLRASWAVLGWKMAQAGLAFGADELGGWGVEEQVAYGGNIRPAAQVSRAEVLAGIREGMREPMEVQRCDWGF